MIRIAISAANLFAAVRSALSLTGQVYLPDCLDYAGTRPPRPIRLRTARTGWASRKDPGPNAGMDASPLVEYARESSKRNQTAATWSAFAAAFAGLAWALQLFG